MFFQRNGNFDLFDCNIVSKEQQILMDLEYQSHGNVDIVKQLNRLDKLTSKLNLTLKDVPNSQPISKGQKEQLNKYISNDKASQLVKYMDKEVISADRQIGAKGSRWNILHICAKYDAVQCTKILLKRTYQQDASQYLNILNEKTAQGYTALMITIIYQSNRTLQLLLRLGGSDLSIMESSKMRAYDLAINYHNQKAIQELIIYQDRCKKQIYLNKQELGEEIELVQEKGWFNSAMGCLLDYLLCLNREEMDNEQGNHILLQKLGSLIKGEEKISEIDSVKIGSRRDIEDYQIEWKKLSSIQGQRFILFDSFKPLDISQNQFSLRNNLILFQALSDYSWVLKRAISRYDDGNKNKSKPDMQKFTINLYKNFMGIKLQVDECVPFVKERGQIMFLSNPNQIWPLMLQKGLAKLFNSYIALHGIIPSETLEDITGFYAHSIPISTFPSNSLIADLQDLNMKGYIVLLEGREKTDLNSSSESQLYSILNYYQKGNTRKILINCPNVVRDWKQSKQNRQLAIIKTHFNKHNQSCIWIDQSKLDYYFKNITICYLRQNYLRSQLKIKMKIKGQQEYSNKDVFQEKGKTFKSYKKGIFFRFKIAKKTEDPIVLQLIDMETKHRYDLSDLSGWRNDGSEVLIHQSESQQCKELTKIISEPGQYTCMYEICEKKIVCDQNHSEVNRSIIKYRKEGQEDKEQVKQSQQCKKKVILNLGPEHLKDLLLLAWWVEPIQIQYLQEEFGTIQWLSHFKNYSISNWSYLMKDRSEQQCFLYETVNKKTLLLIKTKSVRKMYLQFIDFQLLQWSKTNSLIQGKLTESKQFGDSIELVRENKNNNFFYTVISNICVQELQRQKKIRFFYQYF